MPTHCPGLLVRLKNSGVKPVWRSYAVAVHRVAQRHRPPGIPPVVDLLHGRISFAGERAPARGPGTRQTRTASLPLNATVRVVHEDHVVLVQHRQQDVFQLALPQLAFIEPWPSSAHATRGQESRA